MIVKFGILRKNYSVLIINVFGLRLLKKTEDTKDESSL